MQKRIIVVDLDGTYIKSDILYESILLFIKKYPHKIFKILFMIMKGKIAFKEYLYKYVSPNIELLPYNTDLHNWLISEKQNGKEMVLATASLQQYAEKINEHIGLFNDVFGTKTENLSSTKKRDFLDSKYGIGNYEYIGNSSADLKVWEHAHHAHTVNASGRIIRRLMKNKKSGLKFDTENSSIKNIVKTLRLHQWSKNVLIFLPLLAAVKFTSIDLFLKGIFAFISFGTCASSVYILNDLLDIELDRQHIRKKNRPIPSGNLSIPKAVILIPALLLISISAAIVYLSKPFLIVLLFYYLLTINYSFWLKGKVILDVIILSLLYTIRVIAGNVAFGLIPTFWLLVFSIFIFTSLAFVKRYTELNSNSNKENDEKLHGRGYYQTDFALLSSLGGSAGYLSVLVIGLYINDLTFNPRYNTPQWLWIVCPLLLYWISRVWLLAHRGEMHDDPIVFAMKDRQSYLVALLTIIFYIMAIYF